MTFYAQNLLGGLAYGSLLFLIAAGFTLIFGLMRVVNIAQTSFFLVGVYTGLTLLRAHVAFWLAVPMAGATVTVIGLFIYRVFLHRYHADELIALLLTLGFALMLDDGALALWGGNPESVPAPGALAASLQLGTLVFPSYWLALIGISLLIAAALRAMERRTMLGAIIRAGVDDEEMARGLGIDVDRAFYIVFAIGAFLAGAGGLLGGPITGAYPGLDGDLLPLAFAVIIIGGIGSLEGAYVGSLVIGLVSTFGKALFPELSYFTIFVPVAAIMSLRPQGLLGRKR
ncbi:MAG TPA: branched-chain amino acid ABC transporter permease [bacterium]|nr:branched-chain amino acid ABC transporter permease [bacterium]